MVLDTVTRLTAASLAKSFWVKIIGITKLPWSGWPKRLVNRAKELMTRRWEELKASCPTWAVSEYRRCDKASMVKAAKLGCCCIRSPTVAADHDRVITVGDIAVTAVSIGAGHVFKTRPMKSPGWIKHKIFSCPSSLYIETLARPRRIR